MIFGIKPLILGIMIYIFGMIYFGFSKIGLAFDILGLFPLGYLLINELKEDKSSPEEVQER
jgi:hypothetical protein